MNLNTNPAHISRCLEMTRFSHEYAAIHAHYGGRVAERSRVPLIFHILEGVSIIHALDGMLPDGRRFNDRVAAAGYCLHPLFQSDQDLATVGVQYALGPYRRPAGSTLLAMEYRWRANNWLSDKVQKGTTGPQLVGGPDAGDLPEVRAMLIADKVQNYKDFLTHHCGKHARSDELDVYFTTWLDHLGVDTEMFNALCKLATSATAP
jgi:hypothetical protein